MIDPEDKYVYMDERIDSFLKGMMSKEEEQAFKKDVTEDAELRQRAKEHLLLLKGIQQFGHERDQQIIDDTRRSGASTTTKIFTMRRVVTALSVAACLVFVILIGPHYLHDNGNDGKMAMNENPALDYAVTESDAMLSGMQKQLRGTDTEAVKAELKPVFENVLKDKVVKSDVTKLEMLYATSTDDTVDDVDDYAMEIGWFLAVAYIKDNNNIKAASTLRSLLKEYPDFKEATLLLQKLE